MIDDPQDYQELEKELRSLRLRAPSAALHARIGEALAASQALADFRALDQAALRTAPVSTSAEPNRWLHWGLPVAAALVVGTLAFRGPPPPPPANPLSLPASAPAGAAQNVPLSSSTADRELDLSLATRHPGVDLYKPVAAENVSFGDDEEKVITLPDGTTARELRQRYLDKVTWRNPQTNAWLTWSVPRDEVRVVPIRAY